MAKEVLLSGGFLAAQTRAKLEADFVVRELPPPDARAAFFAEHGGNIGALITGGHQRADAAMMDNMPHLAVISCYGVGYDGIDVKEATKRGIWVCNTPEVLNDDVADMAMALMLAVVRRIPAAERFVRGGQWQKGNFHLTDRLSGRRLGMLGMGRIGGAIVRRALAFGMTITYHATAKKDTPHQWAKSPATLAKECDILCAAMPATPQTTGIVNAEVLQALGPEGYFVNIGRGALADEPALVDALQKGIIAGAALDVFADEPNVPQALMNMDNVVLSPHQGSATTHTRKAMSELTAENAIRVLHGQPPQASVNNPR
ncbi:MAG: 2-hydroxyacid dehydrogenase [Gammaproteobacteria bacterium]